MERWDVVVAAGVTFWEAQRLALRRRDGAKLRSRKSCADDPRSPTWVNSDSFNTLTGDGLVVVDFGWSRLVLHMIVHRPVRLRLLDGPNAPASSRTSRGFCPPGREWL